MSTPLLKPTLYAEGPDDSPSLLGGRCCCGHVFFPMQDYGCEKCGAPGEALRPKLLSGFGKLIASAVVHIHADPERATPFAVGTIALDDGPVIRSLLTDAIEVPGCRRVEAVLIEVTPTDDSPAALDLRFKPMDHLP